MGLPPQAQQQQFLIAGFETARKHAADMNERAVQVSLDIGKEKTQFFEKIALASGGTIALVVSFVGSHVGRLQPPWLLRSALVALVLSMVGAMYRNWRFQFYFLAVYARQYMEAKQQKMYRQRDYVIAFPALALNDDGTPVNLTVFHQQIVEDEKTFKTKIKECQDQEDSSFTIVKYFEYVTLTLIVAGMGMLVGLAWRNF
jgi:hypothetical protein